MAPIAIVGARLFDGTGAPVIEDATVVLERELIVACGPRERTAVPAGARTIAGRGHTVLPGFIDMHTHVQPQALPLWLAYGITTVKDVGNSFERILPWRAAERSGGDGGPRIYCCGPLIDGAEPFWPDHSLALANDEDAVRAADLLDEKRVDACKAYMMLPAAAMRTFVRRAREHGLSTSAHLGQVRAGEAIDCGVAGLEHTAQSLYTEVVPEELIWPAEDRRRRGLGAFWANFVRGWAAVDLGADRTKRIAARLAEQGIYVNPTLITLDRTVERGRRGIEALDADPAMAEYAAVARSGWRETRDRFVEGWSAADYSQAARALEKVMRFTGAMFEAGVRLHAATDAPFAYILPGSSFHRELELLVRSGLSPAAALRAATSVPAETLGASDIGVVAPGKRADLVLVVGDPTRTIAATTGIAMVFKRGTPVDRAALFAAARSDAPAASGPGH